MQIRKHKDGTYSLTGLSRADLESLSFGALAAEIFYGKPMDYPADKEYTLRRQRAFGRLANELKKMSDDWRGPARTVELESDNFDASDRIYTRPVTS